MNGPIQKVLTTEGFSLVELLVAVVILSIGVLGLAGTTTFMVRQTTLAAATTERVAAYQYIVEEIRALPFDSIDTGSGTLGNFDYRYSLQSQSARTKSILIQVSGPGVARLVAGALPAMSNNVADSLVYGVIRP